MQHVLLDGDTLTLEEVEAVALGRARAELAPAARARVAAARALVEARLDDGLPHYGINTGFGTLAEVRIPRDDLRRLQRNLVLSHSVGVGDPLPAAEARALMLLRAACLAKGLSGIRPETLELLLALLDRGVTPVVPERGSVGASGDLAPLAHLALVLIGEGEAVVGGERVPGAEALRRAGLRPAVLEPKEGLALVNGTQAMAAVGALALRRAERLCDLADLAGAMTLEGLSGSHRPFMAEIQAARGQAGQAASAARLRGLLAGSAINAAHQGPDCHKV
ncbi:MAG TPA: aromatic amino acid lyase, partial [Anaeromyxobacteraceae bacterium]|nr:aromatic amino acid lyase [Anaeromyxobacteraceae bacterium]